MILGVHPNIPLGLSSCTQELADTVQLYNFGSDCYEKTCVRKHCEHSCQELPSSLTKCIYAQNLSLRPELCFAKYFADVNHTTTHWLLGLGCFPISLSDDNCTVGWNGLLSLDLLQFRYCVTLHFAGEINVSAFLLTLGSHLVFLSRVDCSLTHAALFIPSHTSLPSRHENFISSPIYTNILKKGSKKDKLQIKGGGGDRNNFRITDKCIIKSIIILQKCPSIKRA